MKFFLKWDYFSITVICFAGLIFLFFAIRSIFSLNDYYALDRKTAADVFSWEIRKIKDYYYLAAHYKYDTGHGKKEAETVLDGRFLNYSAAFDALQQFAKRDYMAFYASKAPQKVTILKDFSLKNLIYTFVSFGVLIYFLILKRRFQKFNL